MIDKCLIIIFCLIFFQGKGQVWDDFSDGELHQNPEWSGDTVSFRVTQDFVMQLNAAAAGKASLLTVFEPEELGELTSREWSIFLRLTFSPSVNNMIRWYLWRSVSEVGTAGYEAIYIQVGENGSEDGIDLFYEQGSEIFKLVDGIAGTMVSADNSAKIRVFYSPAGGWDVYAATGSSEWMILQGSAQHLYSFTGGYTGIECVFTSSNVNRFYIDDFYSGSYRVDTALPKVISSTVLLPRSIELSFSEVMDSVSLQAAASYSGLAVQEIAYTSLFPSRVKLVLTEDINPDLDYKLQLSGLLDTAHNQMEDTVLSFFWHLPQIFDILVTEVMADPSPALELPEAEYVELFNASAFPVSLSKWSFLIGSREIVFPDYQIDSKQYLLVCTEGFCPQYGPFVHCLDGLSGSSLPNTGSGYLLMDSTGRRIDFGEYTPDWHSGSYQAEGGYSLEMVDWENPCGGKENWASSRHESGGTPGAANSLAAENRDIQIPAIQRVYWVDSLTAGVFFSESILLPDTGEYFVKWNYVVENSTGILKQQESHSGTGNGPDLRVFSAREFMSALEDFQMTIDDQPIAGLLVLDWQQKHLLVQSATPLDEDNPHRFGVVYLTDCAGNNQPEQSVVFQKPSRASPGDLIINELLFNPVGDGVDYIELYNRSEQVFDLSEMLIAGLDAAGQPEEVKVLAGYPYLIFPDSYAVLTTNPEQVMLQYPLHGEDAFVLPAVALPGMANDSGEVLLLDKTMQELDRVHYRESQHYELLRSFEGVALEKVSPELPGMLGSSWFSAAEDAGFGTPGLPNSQLREAPEATGMFSLDYPAFSPNMDGYHDLLVVNYSFPEAGYVAAVQIFNVDGRLVRNLSEEQFLSMRGQICWEGLNDSGLDLPVGVYFVLIRYYHSATGRAGRERLDCALVRAGG